MPTINRVKINFMKCEICNEWSYTIDSEIECFNCKNTLIKNEKTDVWILSTIKNAKHVIELKKKIEKEKHEI